jgi:hypothetical protein
MASPFPFACVLVLSAALAAQDDPPPPPPPVTTTTTTEPVPVKEVEAPIVAGSERDQPALAHHCSAQVMTQPAELPAGSAGKLFVVVALQNQAVIVGGAPLELVYEEKQGPMRLGQWRAWPARAATLYPRYKGQFVHEDTLTLELPIAVEASAEDKLYPLALQLKTELADGRTTAALIAGELQVAGMVRVGRALGSAIVSGVTGTSSGESTPTGGSGGVRGDSVAEAAFTLHATREIAVAAGNSSRLRVRLMMPADFAIARDERLGVPRLALEDAGPGVQLELGAEPTPVEDRAGGVRREVWRQEYEREITLRVDRGAPVGRREATLRFMYAACDAAGMTHPAASVAVPLAIDVQPGGPTGRVATPVGSETDDLADAAPIDADLPQPREGLEFYLLLGGGGSLLVLLIALLVLRRRR